MIHSDDQVLAVYQRVFRESGRDDRAASIIEHLRRVASAPTVEAAEDVIRWWDCWELGPCLSLRRTVKRLRALLTHKRSTRSLVD